MGIPMIKIGDRVVVSGRMETPVYVKDIVDDPENTQIVLILNWGIWGTSRVYLHDQDKTWYKYNESN